MSSSLQIKSPNFINMESPNFINKIKKIEYQEFRSTVLKDRENFIMELKKGNVFIVKNVLSKKIINSLRKNIFHYGISTEKSWHDPYYGAPNFHQIDNKSKHFKLKKCAHVFCFFEWNKDECKVYNYFGEVLNLFNFINGNSEKINKSLINRLQVHHYPKGAGFMDYHSDPDNLVKTIAILYMSEPGEEYHSGGLNLLDVNSNKISIDEKVSKGDMVFAYPTLKHGCDPIEMDKINNNEINWQDSSGRWLFLFNTLQIK